MSLFRHIPSLAEFLSVRYPVWQGHDVPEIISEPTLVRFYKSKPHDMYWGVSGPSHMHRPDNIEIVKSYGVVSDHDEKTLNQIERDFYSENCPKPSTNFGEKYGFISPYGGLYTCGYAGHSLLAGRLAARYCPDGCILAEQALEDAGWITMHFGLINKPNGKPPTKSQIRTLMKMLECWEYGDDYYRTIIDFIDTYKGVMNV